MPSLNKVFLMGNLTKDPNLRYTPRGSAVCDFGLAVNRRYTTENGEQKDEVCFIDIDVWARQAESCGKSLQKGSPVFVEGRLRTDSWQDKEGNKRSRLRVTAERVQFLGAPGGRGGGGVVEEHDDQGADDQAQRPAARSSYQQSDQRQGYQQASPRQSFAERPQARPQPSAGNQPQGQGGQQFAAERPQSPAPPAPPRQAEEPPPMPPPEAFAPEGETEDDIPF